MQTRFGMSKVVYGDVLRKGKFTATLWNVKGQRLNMLQLFERSEKLNRTPQLNGMTSEGSQVYTVERKNRRKITIKETTIIIQAK